MENLLEKCKIFRKNKEEQLRLVDPILIIKWKGNPKAKVLDRLHIKQSDLLSMVDLKNNMKKI
jgi:hypothetical protein